jgi:hypothetical protein
MDITRGDNWEQLGPFIGHKPSQREIPKANTARQRQRHEAWVNYEDATGFRRLYYRAKMRLLLELDRRF